MEDIIDYKEDPVPENGSRKWIAGMIDAILVIIAAGIVHITLSPQYPGNWFLQTPMYLQVFLLFILYRLLLLLLMGKTMGMLVMRLKFLGGQLMPLSIVERLAVAVFVMLNGADYYPENNR